MHLPTTPWLAEIRKHNRIYVGFDASGEFFGQGRTIGGWPRWITKHFNAAKEHDLTGITVRNNTIAKDNSCVLVPMLEFNLRLVAQLALNGEVDLDVELKSWWRRYFSGELPEGMSEVFLSCEDYIEKALYINGTKLMAPTLLSTTPTMVSHAKRWMSRQDTRVGIPSSSPVLVHALPRSCAE